MFTLKTLCSVILTIVYLMILVEICVEKGVLREKICSCILHAIAVGIAVRLMLI